MINNFSSDDDSDDEPIAKRPYRFRQRVDYSEREEEFKERYRFSTRLFELLYRELKDDLDPVESTNHALTGKQKLLLALRFYASGHFYYSVGDMQGSFNRLI